MRSVSTPSKLDQSALYIYDEVSGAYRQATAHDLAGMGGEVSHGVSGARFSSSNLSTAFSGITDAPTSGQKLVITDIIISTDADMRVDFATEGATGTILESIYMKAGDSANLTTRGKRKLPTADKKLMAKTSATGNITLNPYYYSEA
jgi:hypothetical protein